MKYKHRSLLRRITLLTIAICLLALPRSIAAATHDAQPFTYPYGVFLSCDATQMERFLAYQTLVIDAAYFTKADIGALTAAGHTVYTYLNVGSLEDFRPYYSRFAAQTLGPYENWPSERWMDVSYPAWQAYLTDTLAAAYLAKGVDGFFIDNCDVYYQYPTEAIFDGLVTVLRALTATGVAVVINGGDMFVTQYAQQYGGIGDILTGVNQESVLTGIDFAHGTFVRATKEDQAYFNDYLRQVAALGAAVYVLEYTTDESLRQEIAAYCAQMGFTYYIADAIELD